MNSFSFLYSLFYIIMISGFTFTSVIFIMLYNLLVITIESIVYSLLYLFPFINSILIIGDVILLVLYNDDKYNSNSEFIPTIYILYYSLLFIGISIVYYGIHSIESFLLVFIMFIVLVVSVYTYNSVINSNGFINNSIYDSFTSFHNLYYTYLSVINIRFYTLLIFQFILSYIIIESFSIMNSSFIILLYFKMFPFRFWYFFLYLIGDINMIINGISICIGYIIILFFILLMLFLYILYIFINVYIMFSNIINVNTFNSLNILLLIYYSFFSFFLFFSILINSMMINIYSIYEYSYIKILVFILYSFLHLSFLYTILHILIYYIFCLVFIDVGLLYIFFSSILYILILDSVLYSISYIDMYYYYINMIIWYSNSVFRSIYIVTLLFYLLLYSLVYL